MQTTSEFINSGEMAHEERQSQKTRPSEDMGAKGTIFAVLTVVLLLILLLPICLSLAYRDQGQNSIRAANPRIVFTDAESSPPSERMKRNEQITRMKTGWSKGMERVVTVTSADDLEA